MDHLLEGIQQLFGVGSSQPLSFYQTGLRALVLYLAALVMVRLGEKRFIGKNTAFDVIIGFSLGSLISSGITGTAALLPVVAAGSVLVALHFAFARLAFHFDRFGTLIKGSAHQIVRQGELDRDAMKTVNISTKDVYGALRSSEGITDLEPIRAAYMERSGQISFLREKTPKILDINVADGVQTVRIQLE